jgi:PilZ domain-containing protein
MYLGKGLSGRKERRLPIVVAVRLEVLNREGDKEHERTYTDNLSAHGVRVMSARPWQAGDQAEITPVNEETRMRGEVVYCQKLAEAHFFVGLKFPHSPINWSALQRYDGV